jgi:acetyl-CoA C-acetyltransferase
MSDEPVLVGVGQVVHRPDDGPPPTLVELMTAAARLAGDDAGGGLLADVGWIGTPKGTWTHADPAREVAAAIGSPDAHTVMAEVGITQQEVIDVALAAVRDGAGAALVVGAEVNHGSTAGAATAVGEARRAAVEPDEHLVSHDLGISAVEMNHLFVDPPAVYAVLEDAVARAQGWSAEEHHAALGALTESFAAVAAGNPYAWDRSGRSAAEIVDPSDTNRMIAEPYTKLCCSNLRVNQAAALLLTTADRARAAGVPEDRWVFCHGSAFCNHAVPVVQRPELHRSAVVRHAGRRALELAGVDDVDHLDLYSCFPAAVQITAGELGIDRARRLTVTGGMTFAGGPLNSYVLHSTAAMADVLRADPGSTGLVTSVSGFITKFGAAVWSTTPGTWRSEDTTEAARAADPPLTDTDEPGEDVTVVAGTVTHARDGSTTAIDVVETADGVRSLRSTPSP